MKKILFTFICFMFLIKGVSATTNSLAPNSKSSIIIEADTGEILYQYNANERLAPASMTKMMSLLLIMEAIDKGVIKYDDKVTVSKNASDMGGSQILLETGETMTVDDLLKGITIASGNDAVVALAEKIGGTEANFVKMMNDKAKELNLKNTNFQNCHGLDAKDHYSSAYDMAIIAKELVKHQKILDYSSIYETYLRKGTDRQIWLVNTNKLVRFKQGVDGLKTGYTKASGYCLTATMKKDNMRVITVVMGEPDSDTRSDETSGMLDYAFSQYAVETIYDKNSIIDNIPLEKSNLENVDVITLDAAKVVYKKISGKKNITYDLLYNKLNDEIKVGDVIGELILKENDKEIKRIGLTVNKEVKKASFIDLLGRYLKDAIIGNYQYNHLT